MLAGCGEGGVTRASTSEGEVPEGAVVAFDGARQAGIETPTQSSLNLVGFNLREGADTAAIARLMRVWTADARALCSGEMPLGSLETEMNQWPANLTITCGFGPKVFAVAAPERTPGWLRDLPAFTRDRLDPAWGQTDLVLQICSDDPVTCAWALRHMTRAGVDYVSVAWVQQGFMNARGTAPQG